MTENYSTQISTNSLSSAWIRAFETSLQAKGHHVENLVVSIDISSDGVVEDREVRAVLNEFLVAAGKPKVETVANTLFPSSLWNRNAPRALLYNRYMEAFPRIKKCQANSRGTYFQRMIDFRGGLHPCNQLEHIIRNWHAGNHRHSAFQLAIFDPTTDHLRSRILGFPCLHQVCFNPRGANGEGGLGMTAFYATQHILNKAYGNYLGLARLGEFVASEVGLTLKNLTCIAGKGDMQNSNEFPMGNVRKLLDDVRNAS